MSVYILNKDKEKDLYRVTSPKKKKALTVYDKFSVLQIHNDTHLEDHTQFNNSLQVSVGGEESQEVNINNINNNNININNKNNYLKINNNNNNNNNNEEKES